MCLIGLVGVFDFQGTDICARPISRKDRAPGVRYSCTPQLMKPLYTSDSRVKDSHLDLFDVESLQKAKIGRSLLHRGHSMSRECFSSWPGPSQAMGTSWHAGALLMLKISPWEESAASLILQGVGSSYPSRPLASARVHAIINKGWDFHMFVS